MSALRRLSEDDVKLVFDCVFNNNPPPPTLSFQIVVVGSNGMKLSPPSYEYADGLYVLLRPIKKRKEEEEKNMNHRNQRRLEEDPRVPSKLKPFVMKQRLAETCPWSLSGPQFPLPTAIQQRYCYPKGNPEYSQGKGGALWTVYFDNGKEDLEYRLLHVYHSPKRAGNSIEKMTGMMMMMKVPQQATKYLRRDETWSSISCSDMTDGTLDVWEEEEEEEDSRIPKESSCLSPLPYTTICPLNGNCISHEDETLCWMLLSGDKESNEARLSYPVQESNVLGREDDSILSPWTENDLEYGADKASDEISQMMDLQINLERLYADLVRKWILEDTNAQVNVDKRNIMERKGHLISIIVDWAKMIVDNPLMTSERCESVVDATPL